jgi:hypothetical protein
VVVFADDMDVLTSATVRSIPFDCDCVCWLHARVLQEGR